MQKSGVATRVCGGFIALCALSFGPVQESAAGCGDYLNIGRDATTISEHSSAPMSPMTTPCNGPNCHPHDGPPVTPSPEIQPATPTAKAAEIIANFAPDAEPMVERLSEDDARPVPGYAASILRPPKGV